MSVALLLITHGNVGQVLLDTATAVLGTMPLPSAAVSVPMADDRDTSLQRARQALENLDQGDGVLILTDLFGATPCNIACELCNKNSRVIAGLNLPMLIRVLNYPRLSLEKLAVKAITGGKDGVLSCPQRRT